MATKLETVIARRELVKAKLARFQMELDKLDAEIREMGRMIDKAFGASPGAMIVQIGQAVSYEDAMPITPIKGLLVDEMAKLLADADRPMMPADIAEGLKKRGIHVAGTRPANNISAHLCYAKGRFARTSAGWVLRSPLLVAPRTANAAD